MTKKVIETMSNKFPALSSNSSGIILVDKPTGMTSNRCLQRVKRCLGVKKAGHGGSLDPLATGLLPIYVGEATKFSQFSLNSDKAYRVVARLGVRTTTYDAEGDIIETKPVPNITPDALLAVLKKFQGHIEQIPPMYSALKHQGQPLYRLARQGQTIELKSRPVRIDALICVERTSETLTLEVTCSKGTYIRSLVDDIGHELGCGAMVAALRRTRVGDFEASDMVTLDQLMNFFGSSDVVGSSKSLSAMESSESLGLMESSESLDVEGSSRSSNMTPSSETPKVMLRPIESALQALPLMRLNASDVLALRRGQRVSYRDTHHTDHPHPNEVVRLQDENRHFIGIGTIMPSHELVAKRLMAYNSNSF